MTSDEPVLSCPRIDSVQWDCQHAIISVGCASAVDNCCNQVLQGIVPAHPLTGKIRKQWRFLESELYAWAHERVNLVTSDPCLNSRRK